MGGWVGDLPGFMVRWVCGLSMGVGGLSWVGLGGGFRRVKDIFRGTN